MTKYILYLSIFFLPTVIHATETEYLLSICAIFKNEGHYLKEWIEFHKLQGVEHFFLYNNNSTDDYEQVLYQSLNEGS